MALSQCHSKWGPHADPRENLPSAQATGGGRARGRFQPKGADSAFVARIFDGEKEARLIALARGARAGACGCWRARSWSSTLSRPPATQRSSGRCHIIETATRSGFVARIQAAATASRRVPIAAARSVRCVWAEVRWRWTLKVLKTAARIERNSWAEPGL